MNKFNVHWQIIRTRARAIKDVNRKIDFVLQFLNANPNICNYDRVLNWVRMTGIAYPKGSDSNKAFTQTAQELIEKESGYNDQADMDNDLSTIDTEELQLIYKDLKKRKYGFQYATVPKDHVEFIGNLEDEMQRRG